MGLINEWSNNENQFIHRAYADLLVENVIRINIGAIRVHDGIFLHAILVFLIRASFRLMAESIISCHVHVHAIKGHGTHFAYGINSK